MGVTVQVRNLDADVQRQLRQAAEREGLSLSAFLRRKLTELAQELELKEQPGDLSAALMALGGPLHGIKNISSEEIVTIIREGRDER